MVRTVHKPHTIAGENKFPVYAQFVPHMNHATLLVKCAWYTLCTNRTNYNKASSNQKQHSKGHVRYDQSKRRKRTSMGVKHHAKIKHNIVQVQTLQTYFKKRITLHITTLKSNNEVQV